MKFFFLRSGKKFEDKTRVVINPMKFIKNIPESIKTLYFSPINIFEEISRSKAKIADETRITIKK